MKLGHGACVETGHVGVQQNDRTAPLLDSTREDETMRCPGEGPAEYTEENIQVLTDIEVIRLRPGMYIGNTDAQGLHAILFNLVTDSLDDAARGHGCAVRVTLRADGTAEVADDGVPFYLGDPPSGEPAIEFIFTRWHGHAPNAGGRDWLNYAVANALSERLTVLARLPGSVYQHAFRRGVTHAVLQSGGPLDDRGLTVRFRPDPDIFGTAQFDSTTIRDRLRQFAFLHSGVRITFSDETNGTRDEFEYADGVAGFVRHLNADRTPLHADVIAIRGEEEGVRYEVGLQWCEEEDEFPMSFANDWRTSEGGTHFFGFRTALTRTLNDFIRERLSGVRVLTGEEARRGLTVVVLVRMSEPRFYAVTRERLNSPEAERAVASGVRSFLRDYFEANQDVAVRIVRAVRHINKQPGEAD